MGWASGSDLIEVIVRRLDSRRDLTAEQKEEIYKILIDEFMNYDCDTLDEVRVKRFQKVWQQMCGEHDGE